jgi:hypothetical protein
MICPTGFRFLVTVLSKHKNNNSKKKNFFFLPPPLSSSILSLLFHISFIHSISLQYFSLFLSLPLSHFAASIPHVLSSPRSTFRTFFPLLLPLFSLLVSTPESRHHFSLSCTLSPQILWNFLYHKPLILPSFPSFFDSLPLFLLVRVFVPFIQLRIHPSSFCSQSFHFSTGAPVPLVEKLHCFQNKLFRFHF